MLKAILFDLDGTLLPMDEQVFVKGYFTYLYKKVAPYGYQDFALLTDTIWKGVYNMYKNDGSKTNEERFWEIFVQVYGEKSLKDIPLFDSFYANEFKQAKAFTNENPYAKEIVTFAKENVGKVILSTNPIFPKVGQATRLSFLSLKEEDFDYVSNYSNSYYCKPNPLYFKTILEQFNLKPNEVILFGNNTLEDGDCASSLGIKTYLVKGFIIYSPKAKGTYQEIEMKDIIPTIKEEMKARMTKK